MLFSIEVHTCIHCASITHTAANALWPCGSNNALYQIESEGTCKQNYRKYGVKNPFNHRQFLPRVKQRWTQDKECLGTPCYVFFNKSARMQSLTGESANEGMIYLLMRASDQFLEMHGRRPGETVEVSEPVWEEDILTLRMLVTKVVADLGLPPSSVSEELVVDFCRCAAGEIHCTAAVMGGMAAQESIKVVMQQFVPVVGTLVYDGSRSSTATCNL